MFDYSDYFNFLFLPDSPQLLNSSGSTLPAQSQPQNSSHMQPLLDQTMAQAAPSMPNTMHGSLQNTLQAQMQSSLENAMQTSLQNAMQTNTQTALQSSLQATIETSLQTPMQTSLQTQIQSSLQNQLQASISASSNMDKIEDLLESLQKQWCMFGPWGHYGEWVICSRKLYILTQTNRKGVCGVFSQFHKTTKILNI